MLFVSLSSSGVGEYEFSGVESEGGERAGTPLGDEIDEYCDLYDCAGDG